MSDCAFCGNALIRKEYLSSEDLPEMIIPFRITEEEAKECLDAWCRKNRGKPEAKALLRKKDIRKMVVIYRKNVIIGTVE